MKECDNIGSKGLTKGNNGKGLYGQVGDLERMPQS